MKVVIVTLSSLGQKSCGNGTWEMLCHLRSSCCITHYGKHGWLWKCLSRWWFSEVKNCSLGLKAARNYRGWGSYLHCVPGRALTFCLGDSALHEDTEVFAALDAKTILMCQHVFACLLNGWLIFEFSIEIVLFLRSTICSNKINDLERGWKDSLCSINSHISGKMTLKFSRLVF